VLLEKLTVPHLVKKFLTFYVTREFITAFTRTRHLSFSWARSIRSTPISRFLKSILISSSLLLLGLPSLSLSLMFPLLNLCNITYSILKSTQYIRCCACFRRHETPTELGPSVRAALRAKQISNMMTWQV